MKIENKINKLIADFEALNVKAYFVSNSECLHKDELNERYSKSATFRIDYPEGLGFDDSPLASQIWETKEAISELDIKNLEEVYNDALHGYVKLFMPLHDLLDHYSVETKCRRCGDVTRWVFADKSSLTEKQFTERMQHETANPKLYLCSICGMNTVHDILSYI